MRKLLLLLITIMSLSKGIAQNRTIDSLSIILKSSKEDTNKVNTLNIIVRELLMLGEQQRAFEMAEETQRLAEKLQFKKGEGIALNNIAILFYNEGNFPKALEFNLKALKIREAIPDKQGIGASLNNIGLIYYHLSDYKKALDYHIRGLKMREEISDTKGIAGSLSNIGIVYEAMEDYPKALNYYRKSLKIKEEIGDKRGIANSLQGIGMTYGALKNYPGAIDYHYKALKIREELGDKLGMAYSFINIGVTHLAQKHNKKALPHLIYAQQLAAEAGDISLISEVHFQLSEAYTALERHNKALEHYKAYISARDSTFNEENTQKMVRAEMEFEFEKKEQAAKLEQEKKAMLHRVELAQKNTERNAFIAGFALVLALSGVVYRGYRQKKKVNQELDLKNQKIEHAYAVIEEKNKDITDSINYAKNIQQAILPDAQRIMAVFPNSFIHYRPRDIVSGDFYWFYEKEDVKFIAVADCTGHGVPGAFMSMIGSALLSHIIAERGITDVGLILSEMNKGIREALKQDETHNRDGMDIALIRFSSSLLHLQYSGANRPLYIINNNNILEIKGTKAAIGGSTPHDQVFETKDITLNTHDSIYIFSDGYADQFGGDSGKKFMTKSFKELILSLQSLHMKEQRQVFEESFETWKGSYEQVDDVLVVGIRI